MNKLKILQNANEKWDYGDPVPGSQIRAARPSYYHHGIYIGDDQVIHFGEGNSETDSLHPEANTVHISSLSDFLNGAFLEVRSYSLKEKMILRKGSDIVDEAKKMLGSGDYNLITNNCEHFSNYCAFGVKHSVSDKIAR